MRYALFGLVLVGCINDVGEEGQAMGAGETPFGAAAMTNVCADGATVKGIDVSYYQGTINWSAVKNDGVKYAFIRVSDGLQTIDSKFDANWRGAKAAGVMRGAYQFFEVGTDPVAQADLVIRKIGGKMEIGDLPPVIDVEYGSDNGHSASTIARATRQWVNRIKDKLGVEPIVYTGPYHWVDEVGSADFNDLKLWVAHYGTRCPYVPPTWRDWTFHQWSSTARIAGIAGNVDIDDFNGTLDELKRLQWKGDLPRACVSGDFDGVYCDDDGAGGEPIHDRLKRAYDVEIACDHVDGAPLFCGGDATTRGVGLYVVGKTAGMPIANHPDAYDDDDGKPYEKYLNAAADYGIIFGDDANLANHVTRNTLAVWIDRIYELPDSDVDAFTDDDGDAGEARHDRLAAAGLMTGFDDGHGHRLFKGEDAATRGTVARVAVRAADANLPTRHW